MEPKDSREPPPRTEAARLSSMLFSCRELLSMYGDMIEYQMGVRDNWIDRTRAEVDAYRAERGWSPHGFGDET